MKALHVVLLNIVIAGGAIFAYDFMRTDKPLVKPKTKRKSAAVDISAIEDRLKALEAREPPMLHARGEDSTIEARLKALEVRVEELTARESTIPMAEAEVESRPAEADAPFAAGKEPSKSEVEKFKKLAAAARKQERMRRMGKRVAGVTKKLGLSLSEKQQEQLVEAVIAFEPRVDEIWREVKNSDAAQGENVDWRQIITDTNTRIRGELTDRISRFIPQADAEAISAAMNPDK